MPVKKGGKIIPEIRLFERDFYRQVLVFAGSDRFSLYFNKSGLIELNELKTDAAVVATRYKNEKLYSVYIQDFTHCQIEGYNLEASKKGSLELVIPADGKPQINPLSDCGEVVLR